MICPCLEVRPCDGRNLLCGSVRDDRVNQLVRAALTEVLFGEAEVEQVVCVVAQAEICRRLAARCRPRTIRITVEYACEFRRDKGVRTYASPRRLCVFDRDEVRMRSERSASAELEHLRAQRRQTFALSRYWCLRVIKAVEERSRGLKRMRFLESGVSSPIAR